jgi:hypothetical protein
VTGDYFLEVGVCSNDEEMPKTVVRQRKNDDCTAVICCLGWNLPFSDASVCNFLFEVPLVHSYLLRASIYVLFGVLLFSRNVSVVANFKLPTPTTTN